MTATTRPPRMWWRAIVVAAVVFAVMLLTVQHRQIPLVVAMIAAALYAAWRLFNRYLVGVPLGRDPFEKLVKMCDGDRELAARLVDGEMTRAPNVPQAEAARRAIDRLRRDRR